MNGFVDLRLRHVVADVFLQEGEAEDQEVLGAAVDGVVFRRDAVDVLETGGGAQIGVGNEPALFEFAGELGFVFGNDIGKRFLVFDF